MWARFKQYVKARSGQGSTAIGILIIASSVFASGGSVGAEIVPAILAGVGLVHVNG